MKLRVQQHSLMILKLLIDRFGKKRVKPLIARLKFSKSTKNFNQYELDKDKKICEHFKIKLNYIDVDYKKIKSYIKETEKIANAIGGVLREKFNNIFKLIFL